MFCKVRVVTVSLLQDSYLHGAFSTANSLLVPIGFCVYKVRVVTVFLLQDYLHGAFTASSLVVPIGFCVYKVRVATVSLLQRLSARCSHRQQLTGNHRIMR